MSATRIGMILDITESGYRLVIVGIVWALARVHPITKGEELVTQGNSENHEAAIAAGLMAARVYVPDFYMSEERFLEWLKQNEQRVVNSFLTSLDGDIGKFKHEDLIGYAYQEYARSIVERT